MDDKIKVVEVNLTRVAAAVGPWFAPVPSAFFVFRAGEIHLGMPWIIAVIAALVVELLGLSSTAVALELYEYNATKRKTDPEAPTWMAVGVIVVYVLTTISLAVVLDAFESLARFAPAIFPLLSLAGVGVLALRIDHQRRLAKIETGNLERKKRQSSGNRKAANNAEISAKTTGKNNGKQPDGIPATGGKTIDRAKAILAERPGITGSELGRLLGRSERLGRNLKAELIPQVKPELETELNGSNGNGKDHG